MLKKMIASLVLAVVISTPLLSLANPNNAITSPYDFGNYKEHD